MRLALKRAADPAADRFSETALTGLDALDGVDGRLRLNRSGRSQRDLAVLELGDTQAFVIDRPQLPGVATDITTSSVGRSAGAL